MEGHRPPGSWAGRVGTLRFMSRDWGIFVSVTFLSRVGTEMLSSCVAFQPRIHPESGLGVGRDGAER